MTTTRDEIDRKFYNACRDGDLKEVKRLLAAGADVNKTDFGSALASAAQQGFLEIVLVLLDHPQIDLNKIGSFGYNDKCTFF